MDILDMTQFLANGLITEAAFFDRMARFDWEPFRDRSVLVKGCGTTIIPPWAFMAVAARLAGLARAIDYGNEHFSIPIFRYHASEAADVAS